MLFDCPQCGEVFSSSTPLATHLRTDHGVTSDGNNKQVAAISPPPLLSPQISDPRPAKKYDGDYYATRSIQCMDCPSAFVLERQLNDHINYSHNEAVKQRRISRSLPCDYCNDTFRTFSARRKHLQSSHGQSVAYERHPAKFDEVYYKMRKHKCNQCRKAFMIHDRLVEHALSEHNITLESGVTRRRIVSAKKSGGGLVSQPFKCNFCAKCYPTKHGRYQHMHVKHHSDLVIQRRRRNSFKCQLCSSIHRSESSLYQHKRSKHPHLITRRPRATSEGASLAFKCDECAKSYANKGGLYHHMYVKHRDTIVRRTLQTRTKNSQDLPFKCDKCEKCYSTTNSLYQHTHLKHRVGQTSSARVKLNKFFAENPIVDDRARDKACKYCEAKFANGCTKSSHEKICRKKTPIVELNVESVDDAEFTCKLCKKLCTNKRNHDSHVKRMHKPRPYKCDACGGDMTFATLCDFRRHAKNVHAFHIPIMCTRRSGSSAAGKT